MTRYKLGVVIAVVLFSWAAGADRADDRRRAALKGIRAYQVVVEDLNDVASTDGVSTESVRTSGPTRRGQRTGAWHF